MDFFKKNYAWIIATIALIVAVVAISGHSTQTITKLGAISTTTNLPSFGLNSLSIGSGCDNQYSSCTPGTVIDASGNTNVGISINQVGISVIRKSFTSGTTTPCSILSPAALTTLDSVTFAPLTGTTTIATLTLATSTIASATTSVIATQLAYNTQGNAWTWYPGTNNSVVATSTFVNVGLAGSGVGNNTGNGATGGNTGFAVTGTCTAEFHTLY